MFYFIKKDNIKNELTKNMLYTFFITLFFGLIIHTLSINSIIINHDALSHGFQPAEAIGGLLLKQGKWFAYYFRLIFGNISVGSVNSINSILFIALSSALVVSLLDIKNKVLACLIGLMMVSFPSVLCTFSYDSEDMFFFSLLLATISIYCLKRLKKNSYLVGIIFLVFSLGTYQAYIGFAATLLLLIFLIEVLTNSESNKQIFERAVKYLLFLGVSCIIYYIVLNIILKIKGISLSNYRGIDNMASLDLAQIPELIIGTYKKVFLFFLNDFYGTRLPKFYIAYRITILLLLFNLFAVYIKSGIYKNIIKNICFFAILIVFPLSVHLVALLGKNVNTHWLMIYSFVLVFISLIKLFEMNYNASDGLTLNKFAVYIVLFFTVYNWYVLTNSGYLRLKAGYYRAYSTANQVVSLIINYPDYTKEKEVDIIGSYKPDKDSFYSEMGNRFTGVTYGNMFSRQNHYNRIITDFLGLELNFVNSKKEEEIKATNEFINMPVYPDDGCISEINGVVVVKMAEVE